MERTSLYASTRHLLDRKCASSTTAIRRGWPIETHRRGIFLIEYRIFKNSDTPRVTELWNEHPPTRGRASPITLADFEHAVLDKPYFERDGLIVAVEEDRLMGFVHAGFGSARGQFDGHGRRRLPL